VDVKKGKEKIYSESECVVLNFLWMFFYDKIARNKEEFNILICSWSRIMNLHVSRISNIQWKDKIFKTSLTHQSYEVAFLR
jgi:hypothetical protein